MQIFEASRQRVRLKYKKDGLERDLKELKEEISRLELIMKDLYIGEGLSSVKMDGINVILERRKAVKCDQSPELVRWLEENDHHEVMNKPINTNALSSLINGSKTKGTEPLSDSELQEIEHYIKTEQIYRFSLRRA